MSSTEWTHGNNWERLRTRKLNRRGCTYGSRKPASEINDLGNDGLDDGKDEMDNDDCDDLHNDVTQNRDNQKGDHHLLPGVRGRCQSTNGS